MQGVTEDSYVLAICAGADAYKMKIDELAKETREKEKE
jgi:hypothetical protein